MRLRKLHACSAVIIALYAVVHIANHLAGVGGAAQHIAFMEAARTVYRARPVEWLLLAAVTIQVGTGLAQVVRSWRQRRGLLPWLQAGSGAYLAYFLINHVGAVLFGRYALGLDTNFYFAAAGLHVAPFQFYFVPYYFVAVLALFVHVGCALYWRLAATSRSGAQAAVGLMSAAGAVASALIVLALAGVLHPVQIPARYLSTYALFR